MSSCQIQKLISKFLAASTYLKSRPVVVCGYKCTIPTPWSNSGLKLFSGNDEDAQDCTRLAHLRPGHFTQYADLFSRCHASCVPLLSRILDVEQWPENMPNRVGQGPTQSWRGSHIHVYINATWSWTCVQATPSSPDRKITCSGPSRT